CGVRQKRNNNVMNIKFTYGLTFFIIISGILLSFFKAFDDYLWLARSGALVVVVGILYAMAEFYNREYQLRLLQFHTSNLKEITLLESEELDSSRVDEWVENTKVVENKLQSELEKITLKHEAFLLITGTLVWGFGDLPFSFLFGA
ncbi:hypothetical protein AB4506_25065, partial [Vibrio sp. 10N.222.46.A3]